MTAVQKKVTSVVNKAASDLNKATDSLNKTLTKAVSDLNGLTEVSTDLAYEIEFKSAQLEELEAKYSDEVRKKEAELRLQVLESEEVVLDQLLEARELSKISRSDLLSLSEKVTKLEAEMDDEINSQVASEVAKAHSAFKADLSAAQAKHDVDTAELKADLKSAQDANMRLKESEARLLQMLDEERKARVQIASSQQAPVINVPNGK